MNCDIVENETAVNSQSDLDKTSIYLQKQNGSPTVAKPRKMICEEEKSPVEDDDDSGVELGPFLFSSLDQDDNGNIGKIKIWF